MRTLSRHIGRRAIRGYALIMAVLASTFSLLIFVNELGDVGKGTYGISDAALHVLLTLPSLMVELAPATALLGAVVGLGELAAGHELIAMLALGVSPRRIGWSVLRTGVLLMLVVIGTEEFVAPWGVQLAFKRRARAISGVESRRAQQGFWSQDGRRVVNVRRILHGRIPADIEIYEFDDDGRLHLLIWAEQAVIHNSKQWVLLDVVQKVITENETVTEHFSRLPWDSPFAPDQLNLIVLPVETLSPWALYGYVQYLRQTDQNAERPELTLWQKVSMPLSTMGMVLVAIPFVLGPLREATAGKRMLNGGVIAAAFYFGSQLVIQLGSVFHLHPALITLSPVAVLYGVAVWLYRRVR